MGEKTSISWTHHTYNPWWGCTRVSPGCERCYAETFAKRVGVAWGPRAERRFFGDKHWNEPVRWNAAAVKAGERRRVFCASMADVFEDRPELAEHRARLFLLIESTPQLDWLLLTKRPENAVAMAPSGWQEAWPSNAWALTTAEDQRRADERIPHLLRIPAVVRGLSCEPLLGPIDLRSYLWVPRDRSYYGDHSSARRDELHWVIAGGESGHGARPMHPEWARGLRDQCAAAGVAFHFKQWGEWSPGYLEHGNDMDYGTIATAKQHEWPEGYASFRVGKAAAGHLLDGREWQEFPDLRPTT